MVVEPVMALTAGGDLIQLVEAWRVLITRHHIGLFAAQSGAAHQQVVVSGRRQRLGKQQPALQVIDVVVHAVPQVDHTCDDARVLVVKFDADALGAPQDVLVAQVVDRPARSPEFLIARHRSGLGGESVEGDPSLAKTGVGFGPVVCIGSVQAAIDVGQFVAHVADPEVAPQPVILATARLGVELAEGRRRFCHDAVVAERWVMVIGIEAPE